MQSNGMRIALAAVAVAIVVVLFIVLGGGGGSGSTTTPTTSGGGSPKVATIVVKDGKPVGGVQDLSFTEGGQIQFVVKSDVSDEVHFHGYDIGKDVEAGGQVEFDVPATLTGKFEVELENRVVPLAEITVNPS